MQQHVYRVFTPEEAKEMRTLLDTQEWKEGQARTKELTGSIKQNLELKPKQDGELVTALSAKCTQAIAKNVDIVLDTMLRQVMGCKFNKFSAPEEGSDQPGQAYHRHTDAPFMGPVRTDFTAVLALTPEDEYEGGDHHVVPPCGDEIIYRPDAGEMLLYETGYPHWVDPVTKGTRISALTWIESSLATERQRSLMKTCRTLSMDMESRINFEDPDCPFRQWFVDVGVIHSGLQRMWAKR